MADVFYDQVFMGAGETIQACWYIGDPWETPPLPDTTTLVVWEPMPFSPVQGGIALSFTYNETQITITDGEFQFWKTITNATTDLNGLIEATFVYLVSFL
jgi:hypothetical protein